MPSAARGTLISCSRVRTGISGRARACALIAVSVAASSAVLPAQSPAVRAGDGSGVIAGTSLDARVESILRSMTLEEKVGQLVQYSAGQPTGPGTGRSDYNEMIPRGQIGALINVVDPREINQYQRLAMEKSLLSAKHITRSRDGATAVQGPNFQTDTLPEIP